MTQSRDRTTTARATEPAASATAVVANVEPGNRPLAWGPIWAGVLTAFGLFILFSLLALAGGLALVNWEGPTGGNDVPVDAIATIITGLFMVIAFFAGGFVSSWANWDNDEGRGILNGFLVWALSLVLLLIFAALGLGQALGAAGAIFGPGFTPGQIGTDVDVEQLGRAFEAAAWETVLAVVLAMGSAVLGGLVGTRDEFHDKFPYYRSR